MNNASHPLRAKIPAAIGLLLITLLVVGAIVITSHDTRAVATISQPMTTSMASAGQTYKDGSYTEIGNYPSPAGRESIGVTLTIANNVVSDATVTPMAKDSTASSYQSLFSGGYKGMVVGKKLSDINLTNVSGSSLTPKGFMDALNKIENDAKA